MNLPKFKTNDPKNKEEKLICELIKDLNDVTHVFVKLNNPGIVTNETFVVLRDASIGYAGAMVRDLASLLDSHKSQEIFLDEAKEIFNAYIEDLRSKLS